MIGQALQVKSIIEKRKSTNELGHLVWQLVSYSTQMYQLITYEINSTYRSVVGDLMCALDCI